MNLYLSIAFTLFAVVAGMYLLAKTKAEGLGRFFSIISYLVVIVAVLSLACQVGRGALRMACRTGICPPSEKCMPGMMNQGGMHGMSGACRMHAGCCEEDECGESHGRGEGRGGCEMDRGREHGDCCKAKSGCMKEGEEEGEMKKDSAKGK